MMVVVEGEIETNWKRVHSHLLHSRFPAFEEFESKRRVCNGTVFIWTSSDADFDFDHLQEFAEEGLSKRPRMYARLRYRRFDYRTEIEFVGLRFEIEDEIDATHFWIANYIGDPGPMGSQAHLPPTPQHIY